MMDAAVQGIQQGWQQGVEQARQRQMMERQAAAERQREAAEYAERMRRIREAEEAARRAKFEADKAELAGQMKGDASGELGFKEIGSDGLTLKEVGGKDDQLKLGEVGESSPADAFLTDSEGRQISGKRKPRMVPRRGLVQKHPGPVYKNSPPPKSPGEPQPAPPDAPNYPKPEIQAPSSAGICGGVGTSCAVANDGSAMGRSQIFASGRACCANLACRGGSCCVPAGAPCQGPDGRNCCSRSCGNQGACN